VISGDFICAGCAAIDNTNINNTAYNAGDKPFNAFRTGVIVAIAAFEKLAASAARTSIRSAPR
jgi:hypothetical protein